MTSEGRSPRPADPDRDRRRPPCPARGNRGPARRPARPGDRGRRRRTLEEADALVASTPVDVVLLDIRLGTDSGLRWLTPACRGPPDRPRPAVVVLTSYDYPQYAEAALRLGASGFVLKTAPIAELLDAIRRAAAGGLAFGVRPGRGARSPG